MEVFYKTELHQYAHVKLSKKELDILYHFLSYERLPSFIEVYERDKNNQFIFITDTKSDIDVEGLINYLDYVLNHPYIINQIRKDKMQRLMEFRKNKIDKILKGS